MSEPVDPWPEVAAIQRDVNAHYRARRKARQQNPKDTMIDDVCPTHGRCPGCERKLCEECGGDADPWETPDGFACEECFPDLVQHLATVEPLDPEQYIAGRLKPRRWQAACTCHWRGPIRDMGDSTSCYSDATRDRDEHARENGRNAS